MAEKRQRRSPQDSPQGRLLSYCPICESSYHLVEAHLLDEGDGRHLMHVQCQRCKSALLVFVVSDAHGVSSLSVLTDLAPDEVQRVWSRVPVSADDVLAFHTFVRSSGAAWMAEV